MANIILYNDNDQPQTLTGVDKIQVPGAVEGETVVFTEGEVQETVETQFIYDNGTYSFVPENGCSSMVGVNVEVQVPSPVLQTNKTYSITQNGTEVITPDDGEAMTQVTVTTSVQDTESIQTQLSMTETTSVMSLGALLVGACKQGSSWDDVANVINTYFEEVVLRADVQDLATGIPVVYHLDEASTFFAGVGGNDGTSVTFRSAAGTISVPISTGDVELAINFTTDIINSASQQVTSYIQTALGSDVSVTCHDFLHVTNLAIGG